MKRVAKALRRSPGVAAILALAIAWAITIHDLGWAQTANFAQVRALDDGRADIDPWHWETKDKAWVDGHFYSVKAPGLALATLPVYAVLERTGADSVAADAAATARDAPNPKWVANIAPPYRDHGFDQATAEQTGMQVEQETPLVWVLTLFGAVIPATLLLFGVRWLADRIVPGYGTAAAITLGVATIVMTFASEYFSHIAAAALAFAAFLVLFRERHSESTSNRAVALAGLLAGLAVTWEFPLGLVGVVLAVYALSGGFERRRALAYGAGAVLGALPVFLFNWWTLGSPFDFAYGNAVAVSGGSGHDVLGLNDDGFFGITYPKPGAVVDLLFASRGLLTLTPIIAVALWGVFSLRKGRHRAEANVVLAVAAAYFLYTAGYWLPFGGGTPGPRFLIPALPFLALGMAEAYRRAPAITLGLAICSGVCMVVAASTFPLIGDNGTMVWVEQLSEGDLEHTLLTILGVSNPWLALAPVLALVVVSSCLAVRATPIAEIGSIRPAVLIVCGWFGLSVIGPSIAGDTITPMGTGDDAIRLIAAAAGIALLSLIVLRLLGPRLSARAQGSLVAEPSRIS